MRKRLNAQRWRRKRFSCFSFCSTLDDCFWHQVTCDDGMFCLFEISVCLINKLLKRKIGHLLSRPWLYIRCAISLLCFVCPFLFDGESFLIFFFGHFSLTIIAWIKAFFLLEFLDEDGRIRICHSTIGFQDSLEANLFFFFH